MIVPKTSTNGNATHKRPYRPSWPSNFTGRFGAKVGPIGIAVYAVLLECADSKTRTCYPSFATVAARASVSVRSVQLAIARLVKEDLIEVRKKPRKGSRPMNEYLLKDLDGAPSVNAGDALTGSGLAQEVREQGRVSAPGAKELIPHEEYIPMNCPGPSPGDGPAEHLSEPDRKSLFEAVAEVTSSDPEVSRTHILRVCRSLQQAKPPYTAEDVRRWLCRGREEGWLRGEPTLGYLEETIGKVRKSCRKRPPAEDPDAARRRRDHQEQERAEEARRAAEAREGDVFKRAAAKAKAQGLTKAGAS